MEAEVRQISERCSTNSDDAFRIAGKTGIVLRQQDVRRYYLLCIDALNKLILYRREDDIYYPLAFQVGVFCTPRYYNRRAEVSGNRFHCYLDGDLVLEVEDDTWSSGLAGIRTNVLSRFKSVRITSPESAQAQRRELDNILKTVVKNRGTDRQLFRAKHRELLTIVEALSGK